LQSVSESELKKVEGGDDLLKSMDILSASEVAEAGGESGAESLLGEGDDISKSVADQKTNDDFESTKQQWAEYYRTSPVPTSGQIHDRASWLQHEIGEQEKLLNDLTGGNIEHRKKALGQLEKIMPFLMLGHYSLLEVAMYVKAKFAGANVVLSELKSGNTQKPGGEPDAQGQAEPTAPSVSTPPSHAAPIPPASASTPEDITESI
jgi:hypothetical protein